MRDRYGRITGLPYHDSVTPDMTQYHAFNEVDPSTTAAIIEAGFLYKDYDILTNRPNIIADGIVAGILCFVNNENVALQPTLLPENETLTTYPKIQDRSHFECVWLRRTNSKCGC